MSKILDKENLDVYRKFLLALDKEDYSNDKDWVCTDSDQRQYYKRVSRYEIAFKEWEPHWDSLSDPFNTEEANKYGEYKEGKLNIMSDVTPHDLWNEVTAYYDSFGDLWEELGEDPGSFLLIVLECYWEQQYMSSKY